MWEVERKEKEGNGIYNIITKKENQNPYKFNDLNQ